MHTGGFRDPANVRRDLRDARSPVGDEVRQSLGRHLKSARRSRGLLQADVAKALGWPKTRESLIETARVQLTVDDVRAMLRLYRTSDAERETILELAHDAELGATDAFSWITSHSFRKTVATILDDAGQSGRQIADQLGHARPSMTQDVYVGRKARNPRAVAALEAAFEHLDPTKTRAKPGEMGISDDGLDL